MKVYILYSNPYDEGAEIYGAFSTEEKATRAVEIFTNKSNHELYISEIEVDDLEKHFERALSDERIYIGHLSKSIYYPVRGIVNNWDFSPCGLDAFLEKEKHENSLFDFNHYISAHIIAKSKEEAEKIAENMIKNLEEQPKNEMGWRYITWVK